MSQSYSLIGIFLILFIIQGCQSIPPLIQLSDYQGELSLPDGSIYKGKLENGLLHGVGELDWKDGSSFKGDFYQGVMQGEGAYVASDGTSFTGEFYNGLPHGKGEMVTLDGARLEGQFVKGQIQGKGRSSDAFGTSYEGNYVDNEFDGHGIYIDQQGNRYVGEFKKNSPDGQVEVFYKSGSRYRGEVKNWLFDGKGQFTEKNGDKFIGDFVKGEATGQAEVLYQSGDTYRGELQEWELQGKGVYHSTNGRIYKGDFMSGTLTGSGEINYGEGYLYKGEVLDWMPEGYGELIMPGSGQYTGFFKEENFYGKGKMVYENGNVYEGEFKNNLMHGKGSLTLSTPKGRKKVTTGWWVEGYFFGQEKPPEITAELEEKLKKEIEDAKNTSIKLNAEEILYSQYEILNNHLKVLKPSMPDKSELFFISFASYGAQDLFMKEAKFSKDLFDQHYQTQKHSISLINNAKTVENVPLATAFNLELSLNKMSELMQDEDILFLFLTSHGSKNHHLSISLEDVPLNDLSVKKLAELIEKSKIKWKVIIVSSCYSGGFIDELENENTLIITASSSDHVSFGCSDDAEFTYFSQAFFEQALVKSDSFKQAFSKSSILIAQREDKEGYSHSNPQMSMGNKIEQQLKKWRKQLKKEKDRSVASGINIPTTLKN